MGDYSCLMVKPPKKERDAILGWNYQFIPEDILFVKPDSDYTGRDNTPHITVKYGILTNKVEEILPLLPEEDIQIKLGKVSKFDKNPDYDVIKVEIESPELHELNKKISENLECHDTFPEYIPHLTLAYVKKGTGDFLIGNTNLVGVSFKVDSFDFSDAENNHVERKAFLDLEAGDVAIGGDEPLGFDFRTNQPICPGDYHGQELADSHQENDSPWFIYKKRISGPGLMEAAIDHARAYLKDSNLAAEGAKEVTLTPKVDKKPTSTVSKKPTSTVTKGPKSSIRPTDGSSYGLYGLASHLPSLKRLAEFIGDAYPISRTHRTLGPVERNMLVKDFIANTDFQSPNDSYAFWLKDGGYAAAFTFEANPGGSITDLEKQR